MTRRPPVWDLTFQHDDVDSKLVAALERLAQALRVLLWRVGQTHGLSPIQVQFLCYLLYQPEAHRRVSRLAQAFRLTKATVSDAIAALESKRLVRHRPDVSDRRSAVLELTPDGRRLAHRLAAWADSIRDGLSFAELDEKTAVLNFLMRLIVELQRAGFITVARMCLTCRFFRPEAHPGASMPHHCALLDRPLGPATLRVDCLEHVGVETVVPAGPSGQRFAL
ncbi:MAG: MarR family winged helix-turn-helix transcriptional regulator [Acidobacteria bacterium]|nr:MarR family winged helix-turn-helix transcriptional regulator [Acidobacteriota bacterium]MDW7983396.1 MarR family winged helix-turn-helix transcriptional regulator [Acidobacteriota bacterium]